ncbi:GNAT family N-acetyltransferase [Lentilactobacillus kosonis]|uniref:Acetyltransferase, GNAT family n=1 Tax=Lentilactobacillus kosonis TaxID=2810561 RepID=A0A401FK32_9LACO|nr:GNAT family N-acetyltransferase [Lentilactobacillus kosonis]GAY72724.1 acetyltransferase, GNAT family [Lentilactobacillus kosonis]
MAEEVDFRLANEADAAAVIELLKKLQTESDTFVVDSDLNSLTVEDEAKMISLINLSKSSLIAVATLSDELIGIVTVEFLKKGIGELGVAVLNEYQGYQIGSNLVELAVEWAIDYSNLNKMALTVFKDNAPAIHIYEKYGFKVVSELAIDDRASVYMEIDTADI